MPHTPCAPACLTLRMVAEQSCSQCSREFTGSAALAKLCRRWQRVESGQAI
jgi:hypothetical protein